MGRLEPRVRLHAFVVFGPTLSHRSCRISCATWKTIAIRITPRSEAPGVSIAGSSRNPLDVAAWPRRVVVRAGVSGRELRVGSEGTHRGWVVRLTTIRPARTRDPLGERAARRPRTRVAGV